MIKEPKRIRNEDWRMQAVTTLAEDLITSWGTKHDKGAPVKLTARLNYGQKILSFGIPNISALFLDMSHKLWVESQEELLNDETFIEWKGKYIGNNIIHPKSEAILFELMQKRMASIVFAHTALEAFANEVIPENAVVTNERDDKKCTETYNKSQIERYINLDEKIGTILPQLYGVESPKGKKIWQEYLKLKTLRDRIIHIKSDDRKSVSPEDETIWKELLNKRNPDFSLEAKGIIGYLIEKVKEKPRWFIKFPHEEVK